MTRRRLTILLALVLATLVWAAPVSAGGWAEAKLDQPAPAPAAGVETTFAFRILQHGQTPVSWVTATFVATNLATGAQIQVPMRAEDTVGHFVTEVTFPDAGDWSWYVMLAELGTDQDGAGGTLTVLEPAQVAAIRLTELVRRFDGAVGILPSILRWLADGQARAASEG